jgi:4-hydroxy-3-polyprenylbenzoate decarboxylase
MKIALIVSGASGVELADAFLRYLPKEIETHVVLSDHARTVARHEKADIIFHTDEDIAAAIASGSYGVDATAVIPCSMNTLAKIACGIADTLASRAAAVAIKERRPLLLAPRELPFSPIALENMLKLSRLGVIIAPPVLGYYSESDTLEEMERFLVGKWYDILGIENGLYRRWGE